MAKTSREADQSQLRYIWGIEVTTENNSLGTHPGNPAIRISLQLLAEHFNVAC
jgi:hypothetical protein